MHRPKKIETITAGEEFYEDTSGTMMKCQALGNCQTDATGFTVRAVTPLGERDFFQAAGGKPLRLYVADDSSKKPL